LPPFEACSHLKNSRLKMRSEIFFS
jgi:hypothetical protein